MPCTLLLFPNFKGDSGAEFKIKEDRKTLSLRIENVLKGKGKYFKIDLDEVGMEYIIPVEMIRKSIISICDDEEEKKGIKNIVKFKPNKD